MDETFLRRLRELVRLDQQMRLWILLSQPQFDRPCDIWAARTRFDGRYRWSRN